MLAHPRPPPQPVAKPPGQRFVPGRCSHLLPTPERFASLAANQRPFAAILGCSDSRVPPEILFDQGLGDLFVVRVAGNVVATETMGSLGYALEHLRCPLFVVLGHEGCGAVQAALRSKFGHHKESGKIAELVAGIEPALADINPQDPPDLQWRRGVEANVRWAVQRLANTPAGHAALAEGRTTLLGAVYELATGLLRWLPAGAPDHKR